MLQEIARWYPGMVISLRDIRPNARILDPEIPLYLLQLRQPTFVTINYADFQPKDFVHPRYCIIRLKLRQREESFVPAILRSFLLEPQFKSKAKRPGKVISWTKEGGIHCVGV
ncbi:MAG: hypothetical protein HYR56_15905 [Acidobacteria bacterium]|nr:hypothetical protein [Acidobacteriota bacterium]MBI3426313.1 hypothetical protein [Acidobacteriota bacterium]